MHSRRCLTAIRWCPQDTAGGARRGGDDDLLFKRLENNVDGGHDGGGQSVAGRRTDRPARRQNDAPAGPVCAVRLSRHGRELRRRVTCYCDNR